jgi:hypothetical protein
MMYDRRSLLKLLGGMSAGAALPTLPGSVPSAAAQDIINWKAVTNHRNGAAWSYRWPWLLDEIKTRTNGRIVLNVTTVPERLPRCALSAARGSFASRKRRARTTRRRSRSTRQQEIRTDRRSAG